jgi:hypothetical protein
VAVSDWTIPFRSDYAAGPLDLKVAIRSRSAGTSSNKWKDLGQAI